MRHQHRRMGTKRHSTVVQRRSCRRIVGYLGLLAAALALPVILTLRGGGTRFVRDLPLKIPVEPGVWKGIAEDILSSPRSKHDIHIVFSTDCSLYQNYQSILLFNSAEVTVQQCNVLRAFRYSEMMFCFLGSTCCRWCSVGLCSLYEHTAGSLSDRETPACNYSPISAGKCPTFLGP